MIGHPPNERSAVEQKSQLITRSLPAPQEAGGKNSGPIFTLPFHAPGFAVATSVGDRDQLYKRLIITHDDFLAWAGFLDELRPPCQPVSDSF